MLPKIKNIPPLPDFCLRVVFDDGKSFVCDVKDDMAQMESYRGLRSIEGLFDQAQLDQSRTCVFWNEQIDLSSDTIYEYGRVI